MGTRLRLVIAAALGSVAVGCSGPANRIDDLSAPAPDARIELRSLVGRLQVEAGIAVAHAGLALRRPGDLRWMQREIRHVRHALDPSSEDDGPGLGHGVLATAEAVIAAVDAGSLMEGTRAGEGEPPGPASTVMAKVARWAKHAMMLSDNVLTEKHSAERAARWVSAIAVIVGRVRDEAGADGAPIAHARDEDARPHETARR